MKLSSKKIKHVTLIRPPLVLPVSSHQAQQGVPPLGMAYLSAALKENGYLVSCIDSTGEDLLNFRTFEVEGLMTNGLIIDEILDRISFNTDIIGISCMYSNEWVYVKKLIPEIKKKFPEKLIIMGGEHINAEYEYSLKTIKEIDIAVLGEGEETLIDLLDSLNKEIDISKVNGLAYLNNEGNIIKNPPRHRIKDINSIAWPDWSGIPLGNYLDKGLGNDTQNKRSVPILASRGCPYQCTFCTSPYMWTTRWIPRDVNDVINEIKFYVKTYRANHIEFFDMTLVINRKWIKSFCEKMIEESLNITYSLPTGTRTEALNSEVISLLKRSGCIKMSLSPESGSVKTLKRIKKRLNLSHMLDTVKKCNKLGLITKTNFIFGLPGQTLFECVESFIYIFKIAFYGGNDVACFSFVPYPGSDLFDQLMEENQIKRDDQYENFLSKNIYSRVADWKSWSNYISDSMMPFLVVGGMGWFFFWSFLFRPHRFVILLYELLTKKPSTMLAMLLDGIFKNFVIGRKSKKLIKSS